MKLVKALVLLKMARSGAEANRLVKQGSVWVGGCIPPCNARMSPFKCTCNGWHKATNPTEDVFGGAIIRIKDGSWRLLQKENGEKGFDQLPGIGRVTEVIFDVNAKGPFIDKVQVKFWRIVFAVRDSFRKGKNG